MLMLLFDSRRYTAQFPKASIFERLKDYPQTRDAVKAESKERVISVVLLFCILAAGIYGEFLRYGF
jgi:hypothetical protein